MPKRRMAWFTMRPGGLALLWLLLCLCAAGAGAREWVYVVRPGDNLWNLSERYLKNRAYWRQLQTLNGVADPKQMPIGLRLRMPLEWMKTTPMTARVLAVHGEVEIETRSTGRTQRAVKGASLAAGDVIRTQEESSASVEFLDGARVLLPQASQLSVGAVSAYGDSGVFDTEMSLDDGRAEISAPLRQEPGTRFEIRTPSGTTSVRGTQFRVGTEPERSLSRMEVLQGEVAVANAEQSVAVTGGYGTLVEAGRPPGPPVALLPAPDLSGLPDSLHDIETELDFPPLLGAVEYRVQMAANQEFVPLLVDVISTTSKLRLPELPNDRYWLRVRGIDGAGLEGRHAEHEVLLDINLSSPALLEPAPDAVIDRGQPSFRWAMQPGRTTYRFQLAADETFAKPLIDVSGLEQPAMALERPVPPGKYHWRVAAVNATYGDGSFSAAQAFRRLAPAPTPQRSAVSADSIVLRWQSEWQTPQYDVQLAGAPAFDQLVVDRRINSSELAIPRPRAGLYYMRVRAVDAEGYPGPFSSILPVEIRERPPPPKLIEPMNEAVLLANKPIFRWQAREEAVTYRFQLAGERDFLAPLIDRLDTGSTTVSLERALPPARYYWRVAASRATDGQGPFSEAWVFYRPSPAPEFAPAAVDGEQDGISLAGGLAVGALRAPARQGSEVH